MLTFLQSLLTLLLVALIYCRQAIIDWAVLTARSLWHLWHLNGPYNYPLFGCAIYLKWDIQELSFQLEQVLGEVYAKDPNQLGILKSWLGPVPLSLLLRPRHVKVLLESNTNITKPWLYDKPSDWIGRGLLTSTNEKWHSRRKIITPTFHFNLLQGYREVFVAQGRIFAEQLEKVADNGREVDIFPYIKRCALDIICETAMATQLNAQTGGNTEYCDAVSAISGLITDYYRMPWLWFKPIWYASGKGFHFDRLVKFSRDFTMEVIQERRRLMEEDGLLGEQVENVANKAPKKSVFIDMLLLQQAANALSDEDIREEVDTFMFEGHDTTASAMGFTIWLLGQFPEYQARLCSFKRVHEEIDAVFGNDETREPSENDLRQLPYLERCIKESLRVTPSVPVIGRTLSEDLKIDGATLPKGLTVIVSPIVTHRDPEHWERPMTFYPDHFLPEKEAARHPYAFLPFSAGPRNCIGQKFAMAEEKTVLSWFFRQYSVETVEPAPGNRAVPEITLKPTLGFPVRLFKRN